MVFIAGRRVHSRGNWLLSINRKYAVVRKKYTIVNKKVPFLKKKYTSGNKTYVHVAQLIDKCRKLLIRGKKNKINS
jgi:hypothetical protein